MDHACIGGNEQIVQMLISKLSESSLNETSKMNMFRCAFQVSVDFNDFRIANLIVETVKRELNVSTVVNLCVLCVIEQFCVNCAHCMSVT